MDIYKAIQELIQERKRLDAMIASLEACTVGADGRVKSRRGRKNMSPEERAKVSRRMAAYWAARRAESTVASPSGGAEPAAADPMPPPARMATAAGMEALR